MTEPMTKEAAAKYLYDNVHVPVFFNRLNDLGVAPSNAAEAQTMLKMAAQLDYLQQKESEKTQAAGQSLLQKAASHLDQILNQVAPNLNNPLPAMIAATVKQASDNPEIVAACLALQG